MNEFSNNQNHEKIISLIFQIERSIKRAENEAGLEYIIANQIKPLISYKLLAIWRSKDHRKERVSALSGVDSFDENHPNYNFFQSFGKFFYENQKKILATNYQELNNELQIMGGEFKDSFFLWAPLTCLPLNAGGLIFLKESPWQEVEINLVKMIVESCAFGLWAWRRNNKQFQFVNRLISQPKKVAIVTLVVLVIGLIPIKMSVISPAEVVAQDANLISSPIDGVISKIHVQPNSEVSQGDLLISLDKSIFQAQKDIAEKSLAISRAELLRTTTKAFTDDESKAELRVLRSKYEEKFVELNSINEKLERSEILSPRKGVSIFNDVNDWIGKPVVTGEKIMLIANPNLLEMKILVSSEDMIGFEKGAIVKLFLSSSPLDSVAASIDTISYEPSQDANGAFGFIVKAKINDVHMNLRIGQKGSAKIYGDRTVLIYYLLRKPMIFARIFIGL